MALIDDHDDDLIDPWSGEYIEAREPLQFNHTDFDEEDDAWLAKHYPPVKFKLEDVLAKPADPKAFAELEAPTNRKPPQPKQPKRSWWRFWS